MHQEGSKKSLGEGRGKRPTREVTHGLCSKEGTGGAGQLEEAEIVTLQRQKDGSSTEVRVC